jgi:hypothetical protein
MGLFLVLFGARLSRETFSDIIPRFGVFISRLGSNKFPVSRLREFTGKGLICLAVFGAETALFRDNRENSGNGTNRI